MPALALGHDPELVVPDDPRSASTSWRGARSSAS
jgi:hypothetical protein